MFSPPSIGIKAWLWAQHLTVSGKDPEENTMAAEQNNNSYNKLLVFDGEDFEYLKDRLESFFLGHDIDH